MNTFIKKITSRKFLLAVAGIFTGIAMALGVEATDVSTVAGAITALVSVVTYIVTEGKVDAESVKNTIEITGDAIDLFEKEE